MNDNTMTVPKENRVTLPPIMWCAMFDIEVIDPDGWDRSGNFEKDWAKSLTFDEFMDKADESTTSFHKSREVLREVARAKLGVACNCLMMINP